MMRAPYKKLLRSERAAVVIELAMVAPVLALMAIGVVDISNAYSRKLAVEQGTQRAIEKIMQTTETTTVQDTLKAEVQCQVNGTKNDGTCKTSPLLLSDVSVSFRLECTKSDGTMVPQTTNDPATFDDYECDTGETEGKYISVSAMQKYTPMFPTHFLGIDDDGTYHVHATSGMRTK